MTTSRPFSLFANSVRAFILYRQHQHAGVVAQHPKLPNPDISKIIGEQWRQLSLDDKNEWKALAEVSIKEIFHNNLLCPNFSLSKKKLVTRSSFLTIATDLKETANINPLTLHKLLQITLPIAQSAVAKQ